MKDLDGFLPTVAKAWDSKWFGDPMAILDRKLRDTRRELIALNKTNGNVHNNVNTTRAALIRIQDALEAVKKLEAAILQEEALLLQIS